MLTGPLGLILLGIAIVVAIGYGAKWYTGKDEPASAPAAGTGTNPPGNGGTVQAPAAGGGQQAPAQSGQTTPQQGQTPPATQPQADPNQAIIAQRSHIDRSGSAQGKMLVTVYYADGLKGSDTLAPVEVQVAQSPALIQTAAEQVVKAPENLKLFSSVPAGTVVRSVDLRDGVAYVDLSAEANLVQGTAAAETMKATFVYTLTEIKGVKAVQLQVLGHPAMLHGIEWSKPVSRADLEAHGQVQVAPLIKFN